MNRPRTSEGYVMLVVLLVMVLAGTLALIVVGAVHSLQVVEGSDAAGRRAEAAAARGLAVTAGTLRWRPGTMSGAIEGGDPDGRESWRASWTPAPPVAGAVWPRFRVTVSAAASGARRYDELTMELRTEPWATGVTCSGDAEIRAPLSVTGSGVYVGGCLRGREQVAFAEGIVSAVPSGEPADLVRGDVFRAAAVHGGAGIFALGAETHESPEGGPYSLDTDRHRGDAVPEQWLEGPTAEFFVAAAEAASPPGAALHGARLILDDIMTPVGADAFGGTCILMPAMDEVTVEGSAESAAGRLLLIVQGDAVLGGPGETVAFSGGLVVTGHLLVRCPLTLDGSLHAGSMTIEGACRIDVAPGWRGHPLAGAAVPAILEHGS